MAISKKFKKFIFCLEGNWRDNLIKKDSVATSLMFLEQNCDIKHVHRHCGTKESLFYYLNKWKLKKYTDYSICYLAFHGLEGEILVGKDKVTIEEIGKVLENKCKDKIIFFGSCLVMQANKARLDAFLEQTGALCICGYKSSVNFLESSIFEMLVFGLFQKYKDIALVQKEIDTNYSKLAKELDFKIHLL